MSAPEGAMGEARQLPVAQQGPSKPGRGAVLSPDVLLSEIAQLLLTEGAPDLVFAAVADALAELVPHDTLSLYQADNPLRVLRPVLVRDAFVDEILAMGPIAYGTGITGMTAQARSSALSAARRRGLAISATVCGHRLTFAVT